MLPYPGFGYGITQYPKVKSINRNSPNPAGNGNVAYIVTFTESVSGVDASDFALSASGVTGAQIVNVTGSGQTRSVTVSTGNGDGTLRLDLVDDDSIMDVNGSKLGGDGLGNGNFAGQTYTIDNNQAPTNITLSNASVAENQGFSATVGTLSSVDPDAGNTFTYAFCGGTDDSLFSINFSTLKTNAIFDFETKNSYAICIRSTDNLGLGFDKNFTIAITNINEQPTITSDGGGLSASVNATENSTTVTTASASDPDAGAVLTYSISGGADAAKFSINPATGTLTFITAPNFEAPTDSGANNVYDVTVQVSDGTLTDSQSIAVTVHNANEAPTNLSLSNSSVTENQPNDTLVGTLSASDQDTGATFTYSMTCATPGVDNAYFRLDGNNLLTNATFNYEAKSSYSICLRVTDNSALSFDKNFTITVIDIPGLELMWPSNNFHLTSNRPTFVWNVYPGAIGYQIQVGRDAGFTNLIVNATLSGGTTNSYTPTTDLPINTQLYWRVRPRISSLQFGAWSSAFTFFTANPPSTPTLLTPLSGALLPSAVVTLDWADSTTPAGTTFGFYMLEIATDSAFTNMALRLPLYGIANSQFTWSNAVRGKTYYWHVLATTVENSAVTAYSAWSATRSFSIKYAVPTLLTPAHFSAVTTLRPTFTWNGPAGVTFTIQISRSNTFGLGTLSANANTNSYTPGVNLYSRTTYYWRVKVNGTYASDWSTVFSFTTP
jgi:VCBS repeat-containing protein